MAKSSGRGDTVRQKRQAKMKELFEGKKFKILSVVALPEHQQYESPFGNKGRNGYLLAEIGNEDNHFTVGETVLRRAAAEFGCVDLP